MTGEQLFEMIRKHMEFRNIQLAPWWEATIGAQQAWVDFAAEVDRQYQLAAMAHRIMAEREKFLTGDWEKDKPAGPVDLLEITKSLVGRRR